MGRVAVGGMAVAVGGMREGVADAYAVAAGAGVLVRVRLGVALAVRVRVGVIRRVDVALGFAVGVRVGVEVRRSSSAVLLGAGVRVAKGEFVGLAVGSKLKMGTEKAGFGALPLGSSAPATTNEITCWKKLRLAA